jgi:hypothetical protein
LWLSSVIPGKSREVVRSGYVCFHPNPFQFMIKQSAYRPTLYNVWTNFLAEWTD